MTVQEKTKFGLLSILAIAISFTDPQISRAFPVNSELKIHAKSPSLECSVDINLTNRLVHKSGEDKFESVWSVSIGVKRLLVEKVGWKIEKVGSMQEVRAWIPSKAIVSDEGEVALVTLGGGLTFLDSRGHLKNFDPDFLRNLRKRQHRLAGEGASWDAYLDFAYFKNTDEEDEEYDFGYLGWPFGELQISSKDFRTRIVGWGSPSTREQIKRTLIQERRRLERKDESVKRLSQKCLSAIYWAGELDLREASQDIKDLSVLLMRARDAESVLLTTKKSGSSTPLDQLLLNTSSRKLGVTPTESTVVRPPGVQLKPGAETATDYDTRRNHIPEFLINSLKEDILDAIGCPEFHDDVAWYYEIRDSHPVTLKLVFSDEKLVKVITCQPSIVDSDFFAKVLFVGSTRFHFFRHWSGEKMCQNSLLTDPPEKSKTGEDKGVSDGLN